MVESMKEDAQMPLRVHVDKAVRQIKQKYAHLGRERILDDARRLARKRGWRRPWDGEDGAAFKKWIESNRFGLAQEEDKGVPHVSLPEWMIAFLNEQAELVEQGILDAEYT